MAGLQCCHVKNFGKRHLEDVFKEVNPHVAVPSWCAVDTSFGNLVVTLDPHTCFDAEGYLDEMGLGDIDYKEDQRGACAACPATRRILKANTSTSQPGKMGSTIPVCKSDQHRGSARRGPSSSSQRRH